MYCDVAERRTKVLLTGVQAQFNLRFELTAPPGAVPYKHWLKMVGPWVDPVTIQFRFELRTQVITIFNLYLLTLANYGVNLIRIGWVFGQCNLSATAPSGRVEVG
jgi:hypothetical protein